ncbi:DUF1360 domain-containing protein [Halalkalibacter sp. APA_J-10(15)]|uniref:DUF1360 domain-containing protein n=1 Tax=Halalkalibacter sp. APA_J-10(15) TaxID=2933805 RepID=UPI001FF68133|nr:DUF1360 domain-containing protein [Halalkalibacter sp. APA_J-10(15)]MCK0471924.1 DUF1360 domain-containing protein [Halalkalibacter sp. APA_J-10(15)]
MNMMWMDLFIMIFATFRITRLVVNDSITSFLRNPFLEISYMEDENGQLFEKTVIKGKGIRRWIGELLSCYWCFGIWCSFFVVLLYVNVDQVQIGFLVFAVAGVASFIQSMVAD